MLVKNKNMSISLHENIPTPEWSQESDSTCVASKLAEIEFSSDR